MQVNLQKIIWGIFIIPTMMFAATNEKSFTPTSIHVPIRSISLSESADGQGVSVYNCAADTEAGCLVDVIDADALETLAGSASVEEGTYKYIHISTCKSEDSYSAQVKGTLTLDSATRKTASGDAVLKTSGEEAAVSVTFSGCRRTYDLPEDLVVTEDDSLKVQLFLHYNNIAWAVKGDPTIPSGCKQGTTYSVCLAYPDVAPSIGTIEPTVESYLIRKQGEVENTAGGSIILMVDGSGAVLGGMTRRFFSETSVEPEIQQFDTPLKRITKNEDDTYTILNYGSSADTYYFKFTNFTREDHNGVYETADGTKYNYSAKKI